MELKEKQLALEQLIEKIKERNGKPVNINVVCASIEALGIRDVDAHEDYGFQSIEHLSSFIFNTLDSPNFTDLKNKKQQEADDAYLSSVAVSDYMHVKTKLFLKNYSTGLFHLAPIFFQVISIIFFGFSLWTYNGFNDLQSTAVVLGVIIGLVITGGFVQSMGKQVSFYWYNNDFAMALKSSNALFKSGTVGLTLFFVFILVVNLVFDFYPFWFLVIVFVYAFLIGTLLLALSPLYTIKRRYVISATVLLGTFVALALFFFTDTHIYFTHWSGILVSTLSSYIYSNWFLKKASQKVKSFSNSKPRFMLSVYRNLDYFIYGFLIYAFVFTDRIIAWSSNLNRDLPYIIYYEKDYEIGMDLAMLVFFLMAGVLEYSVHSFSRDIDLKQKNTLLSEMSEFNSKMIIMYRKHIRLFFISALVIGVFLVSFITQPWGYRAGFDEQVSLISTKVCLIGSFGYLFLSLGMLNVLYLYTLNQHRKPVWPIAIAFITNIVIGVVLSRTIGYEYSAVGMLVGSVLFMSITSIMTWKFFKKMDYYYYAAY